MKVLVTGGTGFVGGHVVPALAAAGHDVRVLARGTHRARRLPDGVEVVAGSVADAATLDRALEGADACIHLVAVIIERGAQTFDRVNVGGTRAVVEACARAGVGRLVHQSALGAADDARFPYLRSKWQGEEIVRASGLDATVLRPSVLFGPGAGFYRPIVWTLRWMPVYPLPRGGRTLFQPLWIEDLATCMVRALDGAGVKETVDLGGPETASFRDMVTQVMQTLGKRRYMMPIPLWAARPFAFIQERMREPLVTNQQLDMVVLDNACDPDEIRRVFDVEPAAFAETDRRWLALV